MFMFLDSRWALPLHYKISLFAWFLSSTPLLPFIVPITLSQGSKAIITTWLRL
jgi:hypothetical protein